MALTVAELPAGPGGRALRGAAPAARPASRPRTRPALIAGDGTALSAETLNTWLRRARLVSLSLESNGGICRSLLRVRYGVPDPTEEMAR